MTAFLFGCGGGSGGEANTDSNGSNNIAVVTPTISDAVISVAFSPGVPETILKLTINLVDSNSDVKSLTINIYDVNNNQLSTQAYPISLISGLKNGPISELFFIGAATPGNYTYKVFVTDVASHTSNTLSGSFSITAPPTTLQATDGTWYINFTPEYIAYSNTLITSYMDTSYQSEAVNVNSDIASIEAQATAVGNYGSENMANTLLADKIFYVHRFLNDLITYIHTQTAILPYVLDKPTITNFLTNYQTQDLAWPSSFSANGVNSDWLENLSNTTSPSYSTSINNLYTSAIAQINTMQAFYSIVSMP